MFIYNMRRYLDEAGDDGSDDGSSGDTVDVKELAATVQKLAGAVGGIHNNVKALTDSIASLRKPPSSEEEEEEEEEEDDGSNVNLETMSRTDFANHLTKQFGKIVQKELGKLEKRVEQVDTETARERLVKDLNEAQEKHPDLSEWVSEIKELRKENPKLSIKRAIALAKAEDPEKAEKMKAKYGKKDEDGDEKSNGKGQGKGKGFGGLPPGSSRTEKDTRKTAGDAAESAWESALSKLDNPALLNGEHV